MFFSIYDSDPTKEDFSSGANLRKKSSESKVGSESELLTHDTLEHMYDLMYITSDAILRH